MEYNVKQTNNDFLNRNSKNDDNYEFVREFARRTLANLKFIEKEVESRHEAGIEDKDIHDVFEVTQLINSFVGMLIFPKEACYNNIWNRNLFRNSGAEMILRNIVNNPSKYHSTYTREDKNTGHMDKKQQELKNFSRHFRNAVAHNHLKILSDDNASIAGIEFFDIDKHMREVFRVKLSLEEIRILLIALCEAILENPSKNKKVNSGVKPIK